jgi:hypothetical protein
MRYLLQLAICTLIEVLCLVGEGTLKKREVCNDLAHERWHVLHYLVRERLQVVLRDEQVCNCFTELLFIQFVSSQPLCACEYIFIWRLVDAIQWCPVVLMMAKSIPIQFPE